MAAFVRVWMLVGALSVSAHASGIPEQILVDGQAFYGQGDYVRAIGCLERIPNLVTAAPFMDRPDTPTRARVFWELGRCYYALNDSARAEILLRYAVYLDPDLQGGVLALEDDEAAARARVFLARHRTGQINARLASRSAVSAAGRSLILPGWGQLYRGHRLKGFALIGATAALGTTLYISVKSYRDARNAYRATAASELLTGPLPRPFETRYEIAQSRARRANLVTGALLAVWALGIVDNFVVGPHQIALTLPIK